ncbi:hypothetical protein CEP54_007533 [Fusarium duplospermum]|uniref:Uncharacterized protein n=1 Tax=Fusarium duplospermum TaxID=1325734 RepID=A0A428Q0M4_9HYPO|nr:hypothetical protein CEP54_007533 [Fusarium duplospermum]
MRLTRSRKCRIDTSLAKTSQEATTSEPSDSTDASSPVIVVLPKSQEESPTQGTADSALAKQQSIVNGSSSSNPKLRRRARGSGGTKSDKDSSSLSRDPLSKRPRSIPAKRRVPGLLQRIKDRADIEISRAEDAQERADLQIKWKRTTPTPTPTPSIGGEAHDKMAQDMQTWPDQVALQIRPREEAAYNGDVVYQRKSHGPLLGKLASQGSVITIDGEDYVEYRVLAKLRAV